MSHKKAKDKKPLNTINRNYLFLIPAFFVVSFSYFHDKNKNTSLVAQSMTYNSDASTSKHPKNKSAISNKKKAPSKMQKEFTNSYLYATPANEQNTNKKKNTAKNINSNTSAFDSLSKKIKYSGLLADNSSDMAFQKKQLPESTQLPSVLQAGVNYTHVNLNPDGNSSFHGNLGGLQGSYIYRPANNLYAGATLTWSQGKSTGNAGSRYLLYIDTQERLGYTFASKEKKWLMTLFSGLGYRHMGHHLKPSSGDSLRFGYNELYVPVGLLSTYACSSWFSWGLGLTWMPQVFPTVSITPQSGNNWSLSYELANFYVELPMTFAVTKKRNFLITFNPFYQKWKDGHTTAKTSSGLSLGLPSNDYNFWGADLNFGYAF
ncbi:MAG: hypothetical protein NTX49_06325 [Chlamydiae bacterium]|nr:hypothetical protein [Chlamydiota bacterium]